MKVSLKSVINSSKTKNLTKTVETNLKYEGNITTKRKKTNDVMGSIEDNKEANITSFKKNTNVSNSSPRKFNATFADKKDYIIDLTKPINQNRNKSSSKPKKLITNDFIIEKESILLPITNYKMQSINTINLNNNNLRKESEDIGNIDYLINNNKNKNPNYQFLEEFDTFNVNKNNKSGNKDSESNISQSYTQLLKKYKYIKEKNKRHEENHLVMKQKVKDYQKTIEILSLYIKTNQVNNQPKS